MWDINDVNPPESEAVQAEREMWEDIARTAPATTAIEAPVDTTVTFKRLRNGAWGITGPDTLLHTGQQVVVTKRSGETTTVRVGKVVWTGDGKSIAATRRA